MAVVGCQQFGQKIHGIASTNVRTDPSSKATEHGTSKVSTFVFSATCCGLFESPAGVGFGLELVVILPCKAIGHGLCAS